MRTGPDGDGSPHTSTALSLGIGGAELILRRVMIDGDALDAYVNAPGAALAAMLPVAGTGPDGFRITDERGRVRVAHTGTRGAPFAG